MTFTSLRGLSKAFGFSVVLTLASCGGSNPGNSGNVANSVISGTTTTSDGSFTPTLAAKKVARPVVVQPTTTVGTLPVTSVPTGRTVLPEFFGMHLAAQTYEGWPTAKFGTQRTWDSWPGVAWMDLNPSAGVYKWASLDALVNDSTARGVELVYTFGYVPAWASTNPSGACDGLTAGSCYAPNIEAWRAFVTEITTRYKGKIKYWELWNEPNAGNFWKGSETQLVAMARDAYPIIKGTGGMVISPSPQGTSSPVWIKSYLNAGGGPYLDILGFHGYLYGAPEGLRALAANIRSVRDGYGLSSIPIWDTEHSWGEKTWPMGADGGQQAAWLARFLLLSFSEGIERSIWYGWDHFNWGTLFDRNTRQILEPGIAYKEVYNWIMGANFLPCQDSGTVYQCKITRSDISEGVIIWDTQNVSTFVVPIGYTKLRALDGTVTDVSPGQNIAVSIKPVLIEKP